MKTPICSEWGSKNTCYVDFTHVPSSRFHVKWIRVWVSYRLALRLLEAKSPLFAFLARRLMKIRVEKWWTLHRCYRFSRETRPRYNLDDLFSLMRFQRPTRSLLQPILSPSHFLHLFFLSFLFVQNRSVRNIELVERYVLHCTFDLTSSLDRSLDTF